MHEHFFSLIGIGGTMLAATTFLHALFVSAAGVFLRMATGRTEGPVRFLRDALVLVFLSLWLMVAHSIEIAMWAELYMRLDLIKDIEVAFYYAAVSYTTLGYGDVVLAPKWGLLGAIAAANGLLLFGMSAALLVDACLKLRLNARQPAHHQAQ